MLTKLCIFSCYRVVLKLKVFSSEVSSHHLFAELFQARTLNTEKQPTILLFKSLSAKDMLRKE